MFVLVDSLVKCDLFLYKLVWRTWSEETQSS